MALATLGIWFGVNGTKIGGCSRTVDQYKGGI